MCFHAIAAALSTPHVPCFIMSCYAAASSASLWRPSSRPTRAVGQQRGRRQLTVSAAAGFKARWTIDVKFGSKGEAVALLQEWVRDIGSAAGLTATNTSLNTGSVGAPESTLELEVNFTSLAELEDFWSSIPQAQHKAWGQRMQQFIVHGSPQWQVYRCLPAFPEDSAAAVAGSSSSGSSRRIVIGGQALPATSASSSSSGGGSSSTQAGASLMMPSADEVGKYAAEAAAAGGSPPLPAVQQQTASGLSVVSGEEEAQTVLDWKGEPMKINPGDKLPFKFL